MSYITRPKVTHPALARNDLGLTMRDYVGGMSTLCAGCGHDSITGALIQAAFELSIPPHGMAKLSGIGCSSKTPAYFASSSHGFNSVHGRMPSVSTGAAAVNGQLQYIGISGDGDSLSIGIGQFVHAMRRNLNMLYLIEDNGVYGLTKGQFSASADAGSTAKRGEVNEQPAIDPCLLAIASGCRFVARGFSGDRAQLVPLLKAGLSHRGFAMIDVISPCVTFNDHEGSTKSYRFTRENAYPIGHTDFIPPEVEIKAEIGVGEAHRVDLHGGESILLRKLAKEYDLSDRGAAYHYLSRRQGKGEVVTGLLFMQEGGADMHELSRLGETPLSTLQHERLCPGSNALAELQDRLR
ncbi:2-oxoacid:ferredoxin oxidoreductase subunit beta [Geodia barretti]|uniref:2-oxoacid:ferredoxin oxidoreductase subunit beta n=1 Tax=Geodia barretti TaxID=519541 RepID=A0AA35SGE6_GEOBA|nr:2-oxoacid:ferredoxin oxidoreductase subunit beta [Geodia barretti]